MPKGNPFQPTFPHTIFSSAIELESELVKSAKSGALVLTATGRLSRRILHCFRLKKVEEGTPGWETPAVFSLNRWLKDVFDTLWMQSRPLTKMDALHLWHEAVRRVTPLTGLDLSPSLYLELQRTFDVLSRHQFQIGRKSSSENHPLVNWRRNVSLHFMNFLEEKHFLS
jgi:hypothetical protein